MNNNENNYSKQRDINVNTNSNNDEQNIGYQQNNNSNEFINSVDNSFLSNGFHNQFKNNKIKIAIGVVLLFLVIFLLIMCGKNNEKGHNGYTADFGELLRVNEETQKLNVKTISSLEKHSMSNILWNGDFVKLKLYIENPTEVDLTLNLINFELTDSSKNTLYYASSFYTDEDSIFDENVPSGGSAEGYIYFYSSIIENSGAYVTDYSKMSQVVYLKLSVISDIEKTNDNVIHYNREDYYLKIN